MFRKPFNVNTQPAKAGTPYPGFCNRLWSIAPSVLVMLAGLQALAADYQWENGPGYRRAKLQPVGAGKDGFTLLPGEQTGVLFTNFLSEQRALASQILPSGSG